MITLASDFGSPYPAAMRGVVLGRDPNAKLVDVSHSLPRQDVRAAAFWLREILPYFPPAVHLVVVDPGVGTDRAAIVVEAGDHRFVAPDNGVVIPAARALAAADDEDDDDKDGDNDDEAGADASPIDVWAVEYADAASSTFHGRDVFAPAAASLHRLGLGDFTDQSHVRPAEGFVDLSIPDATVQGDQAVAEVVTVDDFGNVITNVPGEFLESAATVRVNDSEVPAVETFAEVPVGQWLVTVGSHGYVECDVNQGRGDDAFGLAAGDELVLERVE